ncbi:11259_t:CDS:2, partial [Gigaspora rosea]
AQLSLPDITILTNFLYQGFKSARQNLSSKPYVEHLPRQNSKSFNAIKPVDLAPTTQIASHPALSSPEAPTLTPLATRPLIRERPSTTHTRQGTAFTIGVDHNSLASLLREHVETTS